MCACVTWDFVNGGEDRSLCCGVVGRSTRLVVEAEGEAGGVGRVAEPQDVGRGGLHGQVQQSCAQTHAFDTASYNKPDLTSFGGVFFGLPVSYKFIHDRAEKQSRK